MKKTYLVPIDFSETSNKAIDAAYQLASKNDGEVVVLHVASDRNSTIEANLLLEKSLSKLSDEQKEIVRSKVIIGEPFLDIGKVADILDAELIVMGTKGAFGAQKIFGSHAEKIIYNTSQPFLVVLSPKIEKINIIVVPLTDDKESVQILKYAARIAKDFVAEIHLVTDEDPEVSEERNVKINYMIADKYLNELGVEHRLIKFYKEESFENQIIMYSKEIDADIIAATYYKTGIFPLPNSFIQKLIENQFDIPVLTVNSDETFDVRSQYSFITV